MFTVYQNKHDFFFVSDPFVLCSSLQQWFFLGMSVITKLISDLVVNAMSSASTSGHRKRSRSRDNRRCVLYPMPIPTTSTVPQFFKLFLCSESGSGRNHDNFADLDRYPPFQYRVRAVLTPVF